MTTSRRAFLRGAAAMHVAVSTGGASAAVKASLAGAGGVTAVLAELGKLGGYPERALNSVVTRCLPKERCI